MQFLTLMLDIFLDTIVDITPIVVLIVFFQLFILRKSMPHPKQLAIGVLFVCNRSDPHSEFFCHIMQKTLDMVFRDNFVFRSVLDHCLNFAHCSA